LGSSCLHLATAYRHSPGAAKLSLARV
jgi:hypothetical protein